jgi:hypothetical protein
MELPSTEVLLSRCPDCGNEKSLATWKPRGLTHCFICGASSSPQKDD